MQHTATTFYSAADFAAGFLAGLARMDVRWGPAAAVGNALSRL